MLKNQSFKKEKCRTGSSEKCHVLFECVTSKRGGEEYAKASHHIFSLRNLVLRLSFPKLNKLYKATQFPWRARKYYLARKMGKT